jgi:hypothetical protein
MCDSNLVIFKTSSLFLKEGETSPNIVLSDTIGGDMYFSFLIQYVPANGPSTTEFVVEDNHHAKINIRTRADAQTKISSPIEIGTYGEAQKLYLDFVVEPSIDGQKEHKLTINFYINK